MDAEVDHYIVLGLPSGEEGAKLTAEEISRAFKMKALQLHPDKRQGDPTAHHNFQKLVLSYEILRDANARKLFDDLLRMKREKTKCHTQQDCKRRKMMADLKEREHAAFDSIKRAREEELISKKLKEEIAQICAMHAEKGSTADGHGSGVDKEKVLKVSWEKNDGGYTAKRLGGLFERFGVVEDVVIESAKKKALVVMASKEAANAVVGHVLGDLSNPLLVSPLQPAQPAASPAVASPVYSSAGEDEKNDGGSYQAYEDYVLEKLRKAGKRKKN